MLTSCKQRCPVAINNCDELGDKLGGGPCNIVMFNVFLVCHIIIMLNLVEWELYVVK